MSDEYSFSTRLTEPSRGPRPFRPGDPVMDSWEIVRRIGAGGYGTVYEIRKNHMGVETRSALKVIPIPKEADYVESLKALGSSNHQIETELRKQVSRGVAEVETMRRLIDHPAVVRCEDFSVVQYEDDGSWDIFIRMELLTPLTSWLDTHPITEDLVREIGITFADLIEYCCGQRILHRDIKPSNMFMNSINKVKLGDFGLSRTLSMGSSTHSHGVGTDAFMAPEVASDQHYDQKADVYSLGLVLYWILNGRKLPFVDESASYTQAVMTRLSGKPLPYIKGIENGLMDTVLKACAFRQEDRFMNGQDLKKALQEITANPKDQKKEAQISVVHLAEEGTVLIQQHLAFSAGQTKTIEALNIQDYVLIDGYPRQTEVTIDDLGNPSQSMVTFIYHKQPSQIVIPVLCKTKDDIILKKTTVTLRVNERRILYPDIINGYEQAENSPQNVLVSVDEKGKPIPEDVVFYYRKLIPARDVMIVHQTIAGKALYQATETLKANEKKTYYPMTFSGYESEPDSLQSVTVYVSQSGSLSQNTVTFLYRPKISNAVIPVIHKTKDGIILKQTTATIQPNEKKILYPETISGYERADNSPQSMMVSVDKAGNAVPNSVTFYYRKLVPADEVTIIHQTIDGKVLFQSMETLKADEQKTFYAKSFNGYESNPGAPQNVTVYVDHSGNINQKTVRFTYRPLYHAVVPIYCMTTQRMILRQLTIDINSNEKKTINSIPIKGYKIQEGTPHSVVIGLDESGNAVPNQIVFTYRKKMHVLVKVLLWVFGASVVCAVLSLLLSML